MLLKNILRSILIFFHIDITKNLEYDRLTQLIMKRVIKNDSNCIDIGCHKGEILDYIIKYAPSGKHFAFEPLPYLYKNLIEVYSNKALIFPYALSDIEGKSTFQFVENAPAYSGIKIRKYDIANPDIKEIEVELKILDNIIPPGTKIDFIKIDVEGGEYGVIKGAKKILKDSQPVMIFECGIGASDYYGTNPIEFYKFITDEIGLKISTLKSYINKKKSLSLNEFDNFYKTNKEYYFVAHK